ncbi:major facilitator superfamily MFS_1 (plasmid) [Novosphingobium aromaticivorans DSM 12444]|uniref:Major facilitator superfamily MFS_1 n=1 Tax=Novosphingobium aromaticivorans (strain ATCC 700278 / DSM 12444 / CCUG 56034 / CIP 105152 / NBRC 16084 / F199) TaxID=279238 RepID=A4XEA0_NOVAD|nr:MFS transporter [Novosphingobium aromaticivorans]ABP64261.1 major facilitator superfamily MFS_1 [Novosphingobium aromaticivorans DSM 12444]SCY80664.1 Sugar phosphate permease [Novosphingobium aromaticivorans]
MNQGSTGGIGPGSYRAPENAASERIESSVGGKVVRHLVIPAALYILIGAIDRTNVGFAALEMNKALGLSGTQYGFGAGVLFVGYMIAKYPSVLLYEAIGLRRWLTLITAAWGLCSCLMAAVANEWQLYALRVLIGFSEGGLSSGLMLYLSLWAPERFRATILAIPIASISIAQVVGAPISGLLLDLDRPLGLESWRFMFLVEALPALALAAFAWLHFPDTPADARWLTATERDWIAANVKGARKPAPGQGAERWAVLRSPEGWLCAAIWFCILASNYGIMFWLPQVVKSLSGLSSAMTGVIVALPWAASGIGLVLNARHSDRTGERYLHVAIPAVVGGAGLLLAYIFGAGLPGLVALVIGGACTGCTVAAFWAIPTRLLSPGALAMGIVAINMTGSLAGATVPPLMGYLRETTGSFLPPALLLCGIAVVCACLTLVARRVAARAEAQ